MPYDERAALESMYTRNRATIAATVAANVAAGRKPDDNLGGLLWAGGDLATALPELDKLEAPLAAVPACELEEPIQYFLDKED